MRASGECPALWLLAPPVCHIQPISRHPLSSLHGVCEMLGKLVPPMKGRWRESGAVNLTLAAKSRNSSPDRGRQILHQSSNGLFKILYPPKSFLNKCLECTEQVAWFLPYETTQHGDLVSEPQQG